MGRFYKRRDASRKLSHRHHPVSCECLSMLEYAICAPFLQPFVQRSQTGSQTSLTPCPWLLAAFQACSRKNVKKVVPKNISYLILQQYNNSKIIHTKTITTNHIYLIHSIKSSLPTINYLIHSTKSSLLTISSSHSFLINQNY